jgi:Transposase zinc-binding domain
MSRPTVEVADIVRAQGEPFVDRHQRWLDYQQLKVLRAIRNCRTAALGGHVDACPRCGFKAISFNSCLMGSDSLWRM